MKVLVSGSSGFLGSALCPVLRLKGAEVTSLTSKNCDLTKEVSLNQFNSIKFDRIFHLAAWTQAGDFCLTHPGEQWVINQKINTNFLSWWHEYQPQAKLISIGTSCSYDPLFPLVEENYLKGEPTEDLRAYALTKRMLYSGQVALAKQFGYRYLCVVPSTLYGPGYHTDGRQMHFIFDLIRKILQGKFEGVPVVLWGDGFQRRELVHVDDFVRILLQLDETAENTLVNVGAGEEKSIREFSEIICRIVGFDFGQIQFDASKYSGVRSKCLDNGKLRGLLGDLSLKNLEEGIRETIDWFKQLKGMRSASG